MYYVIVSKDGGTFNTLTKPLENKDRAYIFVEKHKHLFNPDVLQIMYILDEIKH